MDLKTHSSIFFRNMSFSFTDQTIFTDFNLEILPGEVHYLLGQNAAGKSTLVRILSGLLPFQNGTITIGDTVYHPGALIPAKKHRIHTIRQNVGLFDNMTVFDNIYVYCMDARSQKSIRSLAMKFLDEFQVSFELDTFVSALSLAEKQLVEMMIAYIIMPDILIWDDGGFDIHGIHMHQFNLFLNKLKQEKITLLYFSHQISEIVSLADRITIICGKDRYLTLDQSDLNTKDIASYMYGTNIRKLAYPRFPGHSVPCEDLLTVTDLTTRNHTLSGISFTLHAGEILGIAGAAGSGRTQLTQALIGVNPLKRGTIYSHSSGSLIFNPAQAANEHIGYISDEPQKNIFPAMVPASNITISDLNAVSDLSFVNGQKELKIGNHYLALLNISEADKPLHKFSFGEQQKIILARLLFSNTRIIVADEPTKILDSYSKVDIYNLFNSYVSKRNALLLCSSDFSELAGMCDRVLILQDGKISAELCKPQLSEYAIAMSVYQEKLKFSETSTI